MCVCVSQFIGVLNKQAFLSVYTIHECDSFLIRNSIKKALRFFSKKKEKKRDAQHFEKAAHKDSTVSF